MFFGDIEIVFQEWDDELVEEHGKHCGKDFTGAAYYLLFVFSIEVYLKPWYLEHIHTGKKILNLIILISLHLYKLFNHSDKNSPVLKPQQSSRYNFHEYFFH